MTKIGVAVWGLGEHARRNIVPAFRECDTAVLRGVSTRDRVVLQEVATLEGIRAYENPNEMLDDEAVGAVFLSVPTGLHGELGHQVLQAGRHVWVEKPLGRTGDDARALIEHGREQRLGVFEAAMFEHHPQFKRVAEIVASGRLGRIASVEARFGFPHLDHHGFRYSEHLGGGAILDAGFYPLATARHLLSGGLEVVGAAIEYQEGFEVDTGGSAVFRDEHGAHGFFEWGFGRAYRNEVHVWGEDGSLVAKRVFSKPPTLDTSIILHMQSGDIVDEVIPSANHFALMLDAFARSALSGSIQVLMQEALSRSWLIDAVRRAAQDRRTMPAE